MTKEEVEYEILKIFASKIDFEFESYGDLWINYHKTLHCTRKTFDELLNEFQSAGYLGVSVNGHFTPSAKSKTAYINHHIGKHIEKQRKDRENEKFNQELKALQFTNSKGYKILILGGMFIGIIGGVFGIASYYKKDSESITKDQLIIYVDSVRQIDRSNYVDHTMFNAQESLASDTATKILTK